MKNCEVFSFLSQQILTTFFHLTQRTLLNKNKNKNKNKKKDNNFLTIFYNFFYNSCKIKWYEA